MVNEPKLLTALKSARGSVIPLTFFQVKKKCYGKWQVSNQEQAARKIQEVDSKKTGTKMSLRFWFSFS